MKRFLKEDNAKISTKNKEKKMKLKDNGGETKGVSVRQRSGSGQF